MITPQHPLLLGSASPRRRALLQEQGLPLSVLSVDVDESARDGEGALGYLERIVDAKLEAVASRLSAGGRESWPAAVLVADTAVVKEAQILGKPKDEADAARMVTSLLGSTHEVMTRYALGVGPSYARAVVARTLSTRVTFAALPPWMAAQYAATGEGFDKAGAYAIQGRGAFLVESIEGSWSNVVGLPVSQVMADLFGLGLLAGLPGGPR